MTKKRSGAILTFILLLASFLRFYNLMFDAPHFFNPDERNMANSIVQLQMPISLKDWPKCIANELGIRDQGSDKTEEISEKPTTDTRPLTPDPCNLHPHFFAYGQFPLYLAFFSDQFNHRILQTIQLVPTTNDQLPMTAYSSAIFWLRFWSALSSIGTVLVVYLTTKLIVRSTLCTDSALSGITYHVSGKKEKRLLPTTYYLLPILTALFTAFTPGLIQSAHFGTTESLLTFFLLTSVYLSMKLIPTFKSITIFLLLSLVCGLAIGTKLTGFFCLIPPAVAACIQLFLILRNSDHRPQHVVRFIALWFIFLGITIGVTVTASPYNLIDTQGFKGSVFGYEKDVAIGEYKAFYTRQFEGTIPIIFQMEKIFPYALGLPLFIVGLAGFIFSIGSLMWQVFAAIWREISSRLQVVSSLPAQAGKQSKDEIDPSQVGTVELGMNLSAPDTHRPITDRQPLTTNCQLLIFIISFLVYLVPNSILYAKWTRFVTPIFPFFSVFAAIFLYQIFLFFPQQPETDEKVKSKRRKGYFFFIFAILFLLFCLPGLAFFSIYLRDDSRVTATKWIYANIPDRASILFDTGNVIDIPLGLPADDPTKPRPNYTLISFDFYHVDENPDLAMKLFSHLEKADYIFIPSRRIFINHLDRADEFPITAAYYRHLFDGSLGFEEIMEFSSVPALGPLQFPDEQAEESFTVFDHPVVRIYKKVQPMSAEEYRRLLL